MQDALTGGCGGAEFCDFDCVCEAASLELVASS
jgi:hypothetical protein